MSKYNNGALRKAGRWIGVAIAALVVACGGGGGGGAGAVNQPGPPVAEVGLEQPPPASVPVNPGTLEVVAGRPGGQGNLDGNGRDARFVLTTNGIVADPAGNVFLTDGDTRIRRITPQGQVSTVATGVTNGRAIAIDSEGNFFVVDGPGNRILKVSAAGAVTPYAGTGVAGSTDGPAAVAQFRFPQGLARAADGTLYVADSAGTIRRIGRDGVVSTLAARNSADGTQVRFLSASSLALDGAILVVSDGQAVLTVDSAGNVMTAARFSNTDSAGAVAVRDGVIYVRSVATSAVLKISGGTLVAVTAPGFSGFIDGAAADARFAGPGGMAFDGSGNLYLVDAFNSAVRKLDLQGKVSTLAGSPGSDGRVDGAAALASFSFPDSLAQDAAGNLYVSDYLNSAIRKIANGSVSTLVDSRAGGTSDLARPSGLVSDSEGNLDVLLAGAASLRHVSAAGVLGTLVPTGGQSCLPFCFNGFGRGNLVRDGGGGFFVTDPQLNVIRRINAQGNASVIAGSPSPSSSRSGPNGPGSYPQGTYSADRPGAAASFDSPAGLERDGAGNLYVADSRNNTIRKITPAGVVSTYAGVAGPPGDADGAAATARFNYPVGLALDAAGNLYVADRDNALVRKISPQGVVSTVAGQRGIRGVATGPLPAALNQPFGLLLGSRGELFVTDTAERVVLKLLLP